MFESAILSFGTMSITSKVALKSGSSQQGNTRRASVGANCVDAAYRVVSLSTSYS